MSWPGAPGVVPHVTGRPKNNAVLMASLNQRVSIERDVVAGFGDIRVMLSAFLQFVLPHKTRNLFQSFHDI
jgi:hypothetical protein